MRKWFKDEAPEVFVLLHDTHALIHDGLDEHGKPINPRPKSPEADAFFFSIEPWERHIPIGADCLACWKAELPQHKGSSYGQIMARDVRLAEECNARGCEMIVSFKRGPQAVPEQQR